MELPWSEATELAYFLFFGSVTPPLKVSKFLKRVCIYSRGKGLGGSSAINFGVYSVGARDDYNEWASAVGTQVTRVAVVGSN
jgi:choline dehydrogenase-like flavoprotein